MGSGLDIISLLSTGGDAATVGVLFLVWRQSQTIIKLDRRILKLEILLATKLGIDFKELEQSE